MNGSSGGIGDFVEKTHAFIESPFPFVLYIDGDLKKNAEQHAPN